MKKIVFFDRDGTLIENVPYLNDPQKILFFSDTISTLQQLKSKGYEFIIVTNQSGIPRGLITEKQLESIHERMVNLLLAENIPILHIYFSPHMPNSNHPLRKPNPGMILQGLKDYNIDIKKSYMVGDQISDGLAGQNAGLKSFLIKKKHPSSTTIESLSQLLNYL